MQPRGRPSRVTKPTAPRRPNRRIDEDQLAAQFGAHGNTADDDYRAAAAVASAVSGGQQHHGGEAEADEVMGDAGESFKVDEDGEDDGDAEAEPDPDHTHGPNVDAMEVHHGMPMAPMAPNQHQQHLHHPSHAHAHHHQGIDDLTPPEILQGASGLTYAAAAAAAADLGPPPPPAPPVGSTMPAPQPLVAATDFQPNPPPPQPAAQPLLQPAVAPPPPPLPPPPPSHHQHHQPPLPPPPPPPPHHKTTEQLAQESGYEGFKIDSAFAKRMSRDPGQRLVEQRRHGQDLNLVRRSNVEALFAQIAGTEAANPCTHCRKGQGPWTVCVVYSGQMMGSCANCWFNASGSRCSFHEKSQPVQPASHPYAVTVPIAGTAPTGDQPGVASAGSSAFVTGTSPAQLQAAALWSASGALFSHDAGVKGTVQSALMQVRQATPYQRALIQVEVAAKQLALKIVEAEEIAGSLGQDNGVVGEEDGHELEHEQQMHEYDSPPGDDGQDSGS